MILLKKRILQKKGLFRIIELANVFRQILILLKQQINRKDFDIEKH